MEYNPPYGSSDPDAPYVDRNTPGAVVGSKVPAAAIEHPQREIVSVLSKSGVTPDADDLAQLTKAVRSQALNYAQAAGTANALTVTLDPPLTAHQVGLPLRLKAAARNTGAATLNAGPGALPIKTPKGNDLAAGDIPAGSILSVICTGTSWMLAGIAYSDAAPRNTLVYPAGSYSWVCPAEVNVVYVRIWGGGGGGGGVNGAAAAASGGGGGGYSEGWKPVVPGTSYSMVVGASGSPGSAGPTPTAGGAGGTSSFLGITCTGGGGGSPANGAYQNVVPSGGTASGGTFNLNGAGGGVGLPFGNGYGGQGGYTFGASTSLANGLGSHPGGGGGGANGNGAGNPNGNPGGPGANGLIILQY